MTKPLPSYYQIQRERIEPPGNTIPTRTSVRLFSELGNTNHMNITPAQADRIWAILQEGDKP